MTSAPRTNVTTPLIEAEQAIARFGSVADAVLHSGLPMKDLIRAWKRIHAAEEDTSRPQGPTPIRHIRIPDDLWAEVSSLARGGNRSAVVIAALHREIQAQKRVPR